jgi:hypothetical protein
MIVANFWHHRIHIFSMNCIVQLLELIVLRLQLHTHDLELSQSHGHDDKLAQWLMQAVNALRIPSTPLEVDRKKVQASLKSLVSTYDSCFGLLELY